jgi:short-subunit dehydrogenase
MATEETTVATNQVMASPTEARALVSAIPTNRVVLITGAGSGLGRQLAVTLAGEGMAVAAIDLQADPLAALAADLAGKPVAWARADVTDRTALHQAVEQIRQRLGPIELLIASAGIGRETSGLDFRAADVEALVRINLLGVANSIEVVLPGMLARRRGHLVGISSLAAFRGIPRMVGYCASKAGLNALLDGLRVELKPHGIRVTTMCPGWVRTPMTAAMDIQPRPLLEVEDAARRIVRAIHQGRSVVAFPMRSALQAWLLRVLPATFSDRLMTRLLRSWLTRREQRDRARLQGTSSDLSQAAP